MRYLVTAVGDIFGVVRRPGDTFDAAEGLKGSWFTAAPADAQKVEASAPPAPSGRQTKAQKAEVAAAKSLASAGVSASDMT